MLLHTVRMHVLAWATVIGGSLWAEESKVDFQSQIRPILVASCSSCHGGVQQAGSVSFVYKEKVLPPGGWVIEPGDPEASLLIERITSDDPDLVMPPPGDHSQPLSPKEIELLKQWIKEGASWDEHWSRAPLIDPLAATSLTNDSWGRVPFDHLIQAVHSDAGLKPSPDADASEWLRRVSFDLTGFPPRFEETKAFVAHVASAESREDLDKLYAAEVDRLLASQRFGERWASVWMDLARYADSKGFEKDPHRDMWPYRDWLINAFNEDMPYDAFTIKQLAGDLINDPEPADLVATAFHRNTQTNTEGGTDDEEFRVAAVIDRVNTTWTVWQATTFGCVQCHAHPYDPIEHEEFFAFYSMLNNTADTDLDSDYPTLKIPAEESKRDEAIVKQRRYEEQRHRRNDVGRKLAISDEWASLQPLAATSSGGSLQIVNDRVLREGGTFPTGVRYVVTTEASPMTAIRIEIAPESDDPSQWPEQGSLVTHVKLELKTKAGQREIDIADAFVDAVTGDYDPRTVLDEKSNRGVGGYPKLHRPRWAVLVLKQPLEETQPDDQLIITMKHGASVTGSVATPTRNFRWSSSHANEWTALLASDDLKFATEELIAAKKNADQIRGARLPVLLPLPESAHRSTRLFIRGNWMERGDEINPAMPAAYCSSASEIRTRLDFAQWLVSDANPLSARVWANRIWGQLFSQGLVETQEDFGASGTAPSHPELLDHLALRLRETHGWRLKPFLRELVLSSTYRQTNRVTKQGKENDPNNRLLSRGPRTRLTAEMVRDQALLVSGLFHDQIGGPSVMPPQPEGIWQTVYSGAKWKTAEGPQRYRRALYTYWRRTSPYPSFLMFDSPTRDICSARRIATNTPLQALVTLNDPVYIECARGLAERSLSQMSPQAIASTQAASDCIAWMYHVVTQREPSEWVRSELSTLYTDLSTESAKSSESQASTDKQPS
ncbi:MAG: PSD1 and planctomycete cytochrome C domain-containing protein, partial [Planctomycetota bacterium]